MLVARGYKTLKEEQKKKKQQQNSQRFEVRLAQGQEGEEPLPEPFDLKKLYAYLQVDDELIRQKHTAQNELLNFKGKEYRNHWRITPEGQLLGHGRSRRAKSQTEAGMSGQGSSSSTSASRAEAYEDDPTPMQRETLALILPKMTRMPSNRTTMRS